MRHQMSASSGADGGGGDDLAEQWRALGVDPERAAQAHRAVREVEAEVYELWPEFAQAWEVFQACGNTQWRVITGLNFARYQGLDYGSVETAIRLHGIPPEDQRQVFAQVRILEDEALKHLND